MKQHAVPQAVMEVEFNLFGAMNVRQFGYVAGSGGIGYFAYLIMPGILKWPLAIICVLFGLALAFVPIDDRSMDQWVSNFLLSLKRATRRVWKSTVEPPAFLLDTSEAIRKGYRTTKPIIIEKQDSLEGAGVFSSINQKSEEDTNIEVQAVDNELARMVLEAKRSLATFAEESQAPKGQTQPSVSTTAPIGTEPFETKEFVASATAVKALTDLAGVLSGGVYDIDGKPVKDAVIIINDNQKRPIQVVQTNAKGLFLADSPIDQGEYVITVKKADIMFESKRIVVISGVIPFLEIKAI